MRNGWYVLNYHDVSWEETPFVRGIGSSCPPDLFHEHLQAFAREGELVSIEEGLAECRKGRMKAPYFSVWFDDGLKGVRKYAAPLLDEHGVKSAISVNSRFMLRQEFFWRFKLSFVNHVDGMRFLRSRLKRHGYPAGGRVGEFVMRKFSPEVLGEIDAVYREFTRDMDRDDAFRVFDDADGIRELRDRGWIVANHSASHYPVAEESSIETFLGEFEECEAALKDSIGQDCRYWVVPFDRSSMRSERLENVFLKGAGDRMLVLVGNLVNDRLAPDAKRLHRITFPVLKAPQLMRYLAAIPHAET